MALISVNGVGAAGLGVGRTVKRAVPDFQFDDIFALSLQLLGHGQDRERGFDGQTLREFAQRYGHEGFP